LRLSHGPYRGAFRHHFFIGGHPEFIASIPRQIQGPRKITLR
jgi:hypothetical protein